MNMEHAFQPATPDCPGIDPDGPEPRTAAGTPERNSPGGGADLFGFGAAHPEPVEGASAPPKPFIILPSLLAKSDPRPAAPPPGRSQDRPGGAPWPHVPVAAMEAVLALRCRQIHDHGHTLEADLALIEQSGKRHYIAQLARAALTAAVEDMMFNKDHDQIRRRLVKSAALILAAIDAEDARAVAEAQAEAEQAQDARQTPSQGPN